MLPKTFLLLATMFFGCHGIGYLDNFGDGSLVVNQGQDLLTDYAELVLDPQSSLPQNFTVRASFYSKLSSVYILQLLNEQYQPW